jgi:hypothetical protein
VGQDRAHLECQRGDPGPLGEGRRLLRAREVLRHVSGDAAQAPVGREQEGVAAGIGELSGNRARLLEVMPRLAVVDAGDAADLQEGDPRGEPEQQRLRRLGKLGQQPCRARAVPHPGCRVAAR